MRIEDDIKLDFKDVLIKPKRSELRSRSQVKLKRTYKFRNGNTWEGIPIIAANMDGVGTVTMADSLGDMGLMTCLVKTLGKKDWETLDDLDVDRQLVIASTGTSEPDLKWLEEVYMNYRVANICLDVANGYTEYFVSTVRKLRENYPGVNIIAGNVVTADMTQELILAGADIVKVGIGPGSVCTTRIKTGVGYPQLSAIMECADAAHGLGGHIIADGGCTCPGDVAKAFAAGADFVMLGGMLAGHDEGEGSIIEKDGEEYVQFYGMSSDTAMNKHKGGVAKYRASEGRTVEVPYKGQVKDTVLDILGGLRSTCTYVGAPTLKQLSKCTTFVRCSQQFNSVFVK